MGLLVSDCANPCQCGGITPPPTKLARHMYGGTMPLTSNFSNLTLGLSNSFDYSGTALHDVEIDTPNPMAGIAYAIMPDGSHVYPVSAQFSVAIWIGFIGGQTLYDQAGISAGDLGGGQYETAFPWGSAFILDSFTWAGNLILQVGLTATFGSDANGSLGVAVQPGNIAIGSSIINAYS